MAEHPSCVLSADCPSGSHCDLEECVQDCHASEPCSGGQTCSPRARCLPEGTPDADPKPSAHYLGELEVGESSVQLTESSTDFSIQLSTTSTESVRYRVQVVGPHLSADRVRGEFTGSTSVPIRVDGSKAKGRDVGGTVKIFTTLGNHVVDAPMHSGLTGTYGGSLRYDGGPVNLGDARLALALIETNGDIRVRIAPQSSLLFPSTSAGETTGHGSFTISDGIDVTVSQRVDETFGGARNNFRRPIGRRMRLRLKPTAGGALEGTFEESIFGLFSRTITTTGHARLEYQPQAAPPSIVVAEDPPMPQGALPAPLGPDKVFGWTSTCEAAVGCGGARPCDAAAVKGAEDVYATPLTRTIRASNNTNAASSPIPAIATACLASVTAKSVNENNGSCGLMVPLACGLRYAVGFPGAPDVKAPLANQLVAESLAPALLVAKENIVAALSDSFARGPAAERQRYDAAMKALGPITTWVTQPDVLEFLRSMSGDAAKGTGTEGSDFPAARTLADAFTTSATIDGETARLSGVTEATSQSNDLVTQAQQRAVLGYLEAITLSELLRSWGTAPSGLQTAFAGMLGPLDRGFAALLAGANTFGVPIGFVPFVYRPEDAPKGPTNFEQMLALSTTSLGAEKLLETKFLENKRAYEANVEKLQTELSNVRLQFDTKLKDMCGADFDPSTITRPEDWSRCGASKTGEIGSLLLDVEAAQARIAAAQSRMLGMKEKIAIDQRALADTQASHQRTLRFITSTGQSLEALAFAEGTINAVQSAIQVASNASLFNAGAPIGEAGIQLALGMMKTAIDVQRTELQTAQSLQYEKAAAEREYVDAMAAIQKELVDLKQLQVEFDQEIIGNLQAALRVRNLLAQARLLLEERSRVLDISSQSPSNSPSFRLLRDRSAVETLSARAEAQRQLYLAARALEYEVNMSIGSVDGAVLNAHDATSLERLQACLLGIYNDSRIAHGSPQEYVTTVSVRKLLGITGPRTDTVTGQRLSEGEQFRHLLLRNENLDGRGGVGVTFATDLLPGNQLWSADVCADRLVTVQAQLVGDFLGDNQAQVNLLLQGGSVMRSCDGESLQTWSLGGRSGSDRAFAVVQAGVNTFGDAPPNSSLFGQSVARASWQLVIPGGADAPSNSDIDLTHVDDIVLKVSHKAVARRTSPLRVDISCLSGIGQ
jgi:hypothetical protein